MMLQVAHETTTHRRARKESPLGLLIACIQERLSLTEREHRQAFKRIISEEGYEDFVDAIVDEWMGIKYSTALRAAQPLSVREVRVNAERRAQERKSEAKRASNAKEIIGARLLDIIMPNGKALRDCTGNECIKFGGFYTRIGEAVGGRSLVGNVLTAADLQIMLKGK